jgi:hypothetical protein
MKILIDFNKYKSLGNVYDDTVTDNHFEFAEKFYIKTKKQIDDHIISAIELNDSNSGDKIAFSVVQYADSGFIKTLSFKIEKIDNKNCFLFLETINK